MAVVSPWVRQQATLSHVLNVREDPRANSGRSWRKDWDSLILIFNGDLPIEWLCSFFWTLNRLGADFSDPMPQGFPGFAKIDLHQGFWPIASPGERLLIAMPCTLIFAALEDLPKYDMPSGNQWLETLLIFF